MLHSIINQARKGLQDMNIVHAVVMSNLHGGAACKAMERRTQAVEACRYLRADKHQCDHDVHLVKSEYYENRYNTLLAEKRGEPNLVVVG